MKKLAVFFLLSVLLVACGGEEEGKTVKIDTKDIKGTVKGSPSDVGMLSNNDGTVESEGKILEFDGKGEIAVYLTKRTISDYKKMKQDDNNYEKVEIVEESDEHILFYLEEKPFGKDKGKEKGYKFYVVKKYNDEANVCLDGRGEDMFKPIEDEELAKKMLSVAKTFEKE